MKKIFSLILAFVMIMSLAACGSSNTTGSSSAQNDAPVQDESSEPSTVTVSGWDAESKAVEVEVPYKPEKVVVLDLANLDILDNLGLGDCIVGAPTITLPYLQSYNNNLPIVGTVKTPDLEAVMACEPDLILMGGRMAEYYDDLNEIAPTLRLTTVSDDGLVEAIRANAKTIGTIFGETEQVDTLLAQYDARIAALAAFAEGKTCVLGMSTSGSFNLLGNDGRCSLIVNEIGFDNIGAEAAATGSSHGSDDSSERGSGGSHGSRGGSTEGSESAGSTPTHGNEVSFEAVVALNPEYIFVMDRDSAIGTSGAQLASEIMENELIMKTDAYQNGNLIILENPGIWYLAEGGITSLGIMLEDLESALLQ
ncbi:MAG: ABC transporter substrate-binding protein [Eubacteriales bacterium]|nr:ABC transporter substrate-binding protein [Eubacteriales bacterium]